MTATRHERNRRIVLIDKKEWAQEREKKFKASIAFAADAKAMRTPAGVTQGEMAAWYSVTASTICRWESGHAMSWNTEDLVRWGQVANEISKKWRKT